MAKFYTRNAASDAEQLCLTYDLVRSTLPVPPGGVLLVLAHLWATEQEGMDEAGVKSWYSRIMADYPKAKSELTKKLPDPYEYAWGLSQGFSNSGYSYTVQLNYPGGPWRFGRVLADYMHKAMVTLQERCGYSFQKELARLPVLGFQDIYEIMCEAGAPPDEKEAYIEDIMSVHGVRVDTYGG